MTCRKDYGTEVNGIAYCPLRKTICHVLCDCGEPLDVTKQEHLESLKNFEEYSHELYFSILADMTREIQQVKDKYREELTKLEIFYNTLDKLKESVV